MAPHSSTLAWKIPWMEEPGGLQSIGSLRVWHDWATSLSRTGEGNGNPLQCSCLENSRDGGASWAAVYGVAQSRTRLKQLSSMIGVSTGLAQNLSLLSSPISPFCSGNVMSYDCPSIVRWKHITCLISQSHSWRAVCLRMKISRVSFISNLDDILVRLQNLGF